jgi:hypothetical protein
LGNGETLYGAVIGVPVKAKAEKEPPAPFTHVTVCRIAELRGRRLSPA